MRRVLDSRVDIFLFKKGIIGKNLVKRCTIGNKLKDVRDSNPLTANTWPAAAFAIVHSDSVESAGVHTNLSGFYGGRYRTRTCGLLRVKQTL
jgi:hypothetical protein